MRQLAPEGGCFYASTNSHVGYRTNLCRIGSGNDFSLVRRERR